MSTRHVRIASVLVGCVVVGSATAQTVRTWTATDTGTQQWSTDANWTPAQKPADGDTVSFTVGAGQTVAFDGSGYTGSAVSITSSQFRGTAGGGSVFNLTDGTLTDLVLSPTLSNLTFNLSDGGAYFSKRFYVGSGGTLNVTGGSFRSALDYTQVNTGGVVNVSGGTMYGVRFQVNAGGTMNVSGGTIDYQFHWGPFGTGATPGVLNLTGGSAVSNDAFRVEQNGVVNMDTGTFVARQGPRIGSRFFAYTGAETPTFNMNSGAFQNEGTTTLGFGSPSTTARSYTAILKLKGGTFNPFTPTALAVNQNDGPNNGDRGEVYVTGGSHNFSDIIIGNFGANTTPKSFIGGAFLSMAGGTLNAANLYLGSSHTIGNNSDFTMTGGVVNLSNAFNINRSLTQAQFETIVAGMPPEQQPNYSWSDSYRNDIRISGGTIALDNANVYIRSVDETANIDLSGAHLLFQNNGSLLEAAGFDYGEVVAGYFGNYSLGTLELADGALLTLQDLFDNVSADGGAPEAVYVRSLVLGAGSTLDLNGYNLYAGVITDAGATFQNGTPFWVPIPEPGSLLLLALGALGPMVRRRR